MARHRDDQRALERVAVRALRRVVALTLVGLATGIVVLAHLAQGTGSSGVGYQHRPAEQWASHSLSSAPIRS